MAVRSRALLCALALVWGPLTMSTGVRADCGYDALDVQGSPVEETLACAAVAGVIGYFAGLDLTIRPPPAILFENEVTIDLGGPDRCRRVVRGYFDAGVGEIHITSALEPGSSRLPWGIAWDERLCRSVLVHELTHAATCQILGGACDSIGVAWRELIAYAVQFELMEAPLRDEILHRYPEVGAFDAPEQVNRILHAMDPDAFGIQAFLFVRALGGSDLIRRILLGDAPFATDELVLDPF